MAEIFLQRDTTSLLDNRFIVVIGDSNMRGVYKDLVLLLQKNKYLQPWQLKKKGEKSFEGDELIEGGTFGEMSNGIHYREVRQYQTDYHLARFYFVTRCYSSYFESILADLAKEPKPDVVLLNSCLWDISRYGAASVDDYKENLEVLFKRLKETLPENCLVIWCTTLPIGKSIRGGFITPEVEFMNSTLRLDVLEANFFVHKLMKEYGFDILDLHYHLRHQLQRRADDGVHWNNTAHRRISNLILSHISEAWGVTPSGYSKSSLTYNKHHNDLNNNRQPDGRNVNRGFNPQMNNFGNTQGDLNLLAQLNDLANNLNNNLGNSLNNTGQQFRNNFMLGPDQFSGEIYHDNYSSGRVSPSQLENINRYGGPIRRPHWDTAMPQFNNQMDMDRSQFHWEPYQNLSNNHVMKSQGPKFPQGPYRQVYFQRGNNW